MIPDSIAYFVVLFQHAGGRDVPPRHKWAAHDRHQGAGKTRGGHRFANNKQDGVHGPASLPILCVKSSLHQTAFAKTNTVLRTIGSFRNTSAL